MNHWWLPADAAAHGPALDRELHLALTLLFGLAVLAHMVMLIALLRRRSQQCRSIIAMELLPFCVIAGLFIWMGVRAERLWAQMRYAGADYSAMQVEVVGEQFVWYVRYPGEDAKFGITRPELVDAGAGNPLGLDQRDDAAHDDRVSSELVLPVNREVDLRLRSLDVIHGFSAPELRIKQNAVPGQTIHIHFTPTQVGRFAVLCTQVCGLGHYRMSATIRVVSPEEFERWSAAR
ncbi:MAG: cytochrome C oxidase subunit II [Acidobacteria bacterium]|nr:cytochrome C oxidase subunit II [Acidobacteriota bacterium]